MSAKSWGDCGSKAKKHTCLPGQNTCAKLQQTLQSWGGTLYAKGCTDTEQWRKNYVKREDLCGDPSLNLCSDHCCNGDQCNRGTLPSASTITFLACAFVVFINSFSSLIKELLFETDQV